jgi:hypothetical protein
VPLSDHEQRLLEQMERALYAEDPKFADSLRKSRRADMDRRGVLLGVVGVVLGLVLLVGGVATQITIVGLAGFVLMLGGAFVGYRSASRAAPQESSAPAASASAPSATRARKTSKSQSGSGFMGRMEQRWQQRKERGQF